MAMPQKDEKNVPAAPMPAMKPQPAPQPAPALPKPPKSSSNGGGLGLGGVCMLVGAIALLATIASQFFAMKAMFAI